MGPKWGTKGDFSPFLAYFGVIIYVDHRFRQNAGGYFMSITVFGHFWANYLCRSRISSKRGGYFTVIALFGPIIYVDHKFRQNAGGYFTIIALFNILILRLFYVDHKFRQNTGGYFTIIANLPNFFGNYLCRSQISSKPAGDILCRSRILPF